MGPPSLVDPLSNPLPPPLLEPLPLLDPPVLPLLNPLPLPPLDAPLPLPDPPPLLVPLLPLPLTAPFGAFRGSPGSAAQENSRQTRQTAPARRANVRPTLWRRMELIAHGVAARGRFGSPFKGGEGAPVR